MVDVLGSGTSLMALAVIVAAQEGLNAPVGETALASTVAMLVLL